MYVYSSLVRRMKWESETNMDKTAWPQLKNKYKKNKAGVEDCNLSNWEAEIGVYEFQTSLDC